MRRFSFIMVVLLLAALSARGQTPPPVETKKVIQTTTQTIPQAITPGMKTAELMALRGEPYYQTSSYSHNTTDQIWLYTKVKASKNVDEKQITDSITHWPTLYRTTTERSCQVGDVFVEVKSGVVTSVMPANNKMAYGPCTISTLEEYLPIVNGVPATTPNRSVTNTQFESIK